MGLNKLVLTQLFIITCHKCAYHCRVINCHGVNEEELLQERPSKAFKQPSEILLIVELWDYFPRD